MCCEANIPTHVDRIRTLVHIVNWNPLSAKRGGDGGGDKISTCSIKLSLKQWTTLQTSRLTVKNHAHDGGQDESDRPTEQHVSADPNIDDRR